MGDGVHPYDRRDMTTCLTGNRQSRLVIMLQPVGLLLRQDQMRPSS